MATSSGAPPPALTPNKATRKRLQSLEELLLRDGREFGCKFACFPAVRLLERLAPDRARVGVALPPSAEIVRFKARQYLGFPPSEIYEVRPPTPNFPIPIMEAAIMGLTGCGPKGVLPLHYSVWLRRLEQEAHETESALRDWLDLFNHRFISLFYRAWEKYRFTLLFERRLFEKSDPYRQQEDDPFTQGLFSLIGLGTPPLRNRLYVSLRQTPDEEPRTDEPRIEDLALLRYSGFFAHRPRSAAALEAMLRAYLQLPVEVIQFQGQWLRLDPMNRSKLGARNHLMGRNVIVGDKVWDVQSKIRIRLGPLTYQKFQEFLPDRSPVPQRKGLFLLTQLVRLYVGPELDIEFQLILRKEEVPACTLGPTGKGMGPRLGWNTWSQRQPKSNDADDAVFQAEEMAAAW